MRVPEAMSYAELVELAERESGRHVAETLQNVMDLHLGDDRAAEDYGLTDPLDPDEPLEETLLAIVSGKIEERLEDVSDAVVTDEDDIEADVGDDPYAVSAATLRDTRDFLRRVLHEFD